MELRKNLQKKDSNCIASQNWVHHESPIGTSIEKRFVLIIYIHMRIRVGTIYRKRQAKTGIEDRMDSKITIHMVFRAKIA